MAVKAPKEKLWLQKGNQLRDLQEVLLFLINVILHPQKSFKELEAQILTE